MVQPLLPIETGVTKVCEFVRACVCVFARGSGGGSNTSLPRPKEASQVGALIGHGGSTDPFHVLLRWPGWRMTYEPLRMTYYALFPSPRPPLLRTVRSKNIRVSENYVILHISSIARSNSLNVFEVYRLLHIVIITSLKYRFLLK